MIVIRSACKAERDGLLYLKAWTTTISTEPAMQYRLHSQLCKLHHFTLNSSPVGSFKQITQVGQYHTLHQAYLALAFLSCYSISTDPTLT